MYLLSCHRARKDLCIKRSHSAFIVQTIKAYQVWQSLNLNVNSKYHPGLSAKHHYRWWVPEAIFNGMK